MTKEERKKEYHRKYRLAHKEDRKKYYLANKEGLKEYGKKYRESNKEKMKKLYSEYYLTHRKEKKKYHSTIKENLPWESHYYSAWTRCNNPKAIGYKYYGGKGIGFLLTMDEIRKLFLRDKAWELERPSIDRIESKGDYVFSNCRFIESSKNSRRAIKDRREHDKD